MAQTNDRNEEVKRRVLEWEERNNMRLEECNRREWVEAMSQIMCLTELEAEEYLDYLQAKQGDI